MTKQYRRSVFLSGNRDSNEKDIIAVLDRYRVPFCLMPPTAGFDILIMVNPVQFWEVKNGALKWTLTKAEHRLKNYCQMEGIPYVIIETMEDAVNAITERNTK